MSDAWKFSGVLSRIRNNALTLADYADAHPQEVWSKFAAFDDETWRCLVAAVRYPDNERLLFAIEERG